MDSITLYYAPIEKFVNAKSRDERGIRSESRRLVSNTSTLTVPDIPGGWQFGLELDENNTVPLIILDANDNISINILSLNPCEYVLSGSELADVINEINKLKSSNTGNDLRDALISFVSQHSESESSLMAMMDLRDKEFITAYENIPDSLQKSILYPILNLKYNGEMKVLEANKKKRMLASGNTMAPNFTLKDIDGKDVSLEDFRGKWVILDFWGTWCPWCIDGFTSLKEAYEKYADVLEIISIDCNESEEAWKNGVKKYELPWVNLFNDEKSSVNLSSYGVYVYPTKIIIDPDGVIRDFTEGEEPEFYNTLAKLLGGS